MQSKAATVDAYLAELPPDRRAAIEAVRKVIRKNLDKTYVENMSYGMIAYCVPHSVYPNGYHCDPKQALPFAALASQKNYMSVYLCTYMSPSEDAWFQAAWKKTGKKLDMGKCCVRFKKAEDLALDVIGESIRRMPAKAYIELYEKTLLPTSKMAATKSKGAKSAAKGRSAPKSKARAASAMGRGGSAKRRSER